MKRISISPRNMWQKKVEELGFGFHSAEAPYWDESCAYIFTAAQIDEVERTTNRLYEMCLAAVQHVIDKKLYKQFAIPQEAIKLIEESWDKDLPSIYGRFDLGFNDGAIKLLEFNADTPTSLFEASIVQWFWLSDFDDSKDQFNSIHEKLIEYWRQLIPHLKPGLVYFTCVTESLEDLTTTEYLRDCALQAGIDCKLIYLEDIGIDHGAQCFVDVNNLPITNIFKLYPWEWLLADEFGTQVVQSSDIMLWIEPAWKMILSNKAILPILWELYPNHPNLLPTYFDTHGMASYVKKPLLSREGANISIVADATLLQSTEGDYGSEGYIFQQYMDLQQENGVVPVLGSWLVGGEAAGIGIRETSGLITDNTSRFVPHYIEH
jgi:glutathionylspermidine synthase